MKHLPSAVGSAGATVGFASSFKSSKGKEAWTIGQRRTSSAGTLGTENLTEVLDAGFVEIICSFDEGPGRIEVCRCLT